MSLCIHIGLKTMKLSTPILSNKKNVSLCLASIFIFYPNFEPLYHLKNMKIQIEPFKQCCRSVNSLFFHLCNCLGAEKIVFLCKVFFVYKLRLQKFWTWSENQNLFFLRQNKVKSTCWVSSLLNPPDIHRKLKQILAPCWLNLVRVCFRFCKHAEHWTNLKRVGKLV